MTITKQIHFDPTDLHGMRVIMDEHGNSNTMYPGTNKNGETVYISVYPERIVIRTEQDNGWNRITPSTEPPRLHPALPVTQPHRHCPLV